MAKTLEERIERAINQISSAEMGEAGERDEGFFVFKEDGRTKHFDILLCKKELCDVIEELHEQNQTLQKKLDEALAKLNEVENDK